MITQPSPTVIVRRLGANHDPVYGSGAADFLIDLEATAQIIETSLLLFEGEWWNDLTEGLPLFQSIIAQPENNRQATIALLIQQTILDVDYVTGLTNVTVSYTSANRQFTYNCNVQTAFGTVAVAFSPGNIAVLPLAN
jgi:hypothetical protein